MVWFGACEGSDGIAYRHIPPHFSFAATCVLNKLPFSLREPVSPLYAYLNPSFSSPLSASITPSLFHSKLKTYLFGKSFIVISWSRQVAFSYRIVVFHTYCVLFNTHLERSLSIWTWLSRLLLYSPYPCVQKCWCPLLNWTTSTLLYL